MASQIHTGRPRESKRHPIVLFNCDADNADVSQERTRSDQATGAPSWESPVSHSSSHGPTVTTILSRNLKSTPSRAIVIVDAICHTLLGNVPALEPRAMGVCYGALMIGSRQTSGRVLVIGHIFTQDLRGAGTLDVPICTKPDISAKGLILPGRNLLRRSAILLPSISCERNRCNHGSVSTTTSSVTLLAYSLFARFLRITLSSEMSPKDT